MKSVLLILARVSSLDISLGKEKRNSLGFEVTNILGDRIDDAYPVKCT